jgi:hypothetical protein
MTRQALRVALLFVAVSSCDSSDSDPAAIDAAAELVQRDDAPISPDSPAPVDLPPETATAEASPDAGTTERPAEIAADGPLETARDAAIADAAAEAKANLRDTTADNVPDLTASPCPGGPAPGDFGAVCGCDRKGTTQCTGLCSTPDDTCVPTGQWHNLSSEFLGPMRLLDTYGGEVNEPFMNTMVGFSGQQWNVIRLPDGTFRLTNMFLQTTKVLEAQAENKVGMARTTESVAQRWRIRAVSNGSFRITNVMLGPGLSLDIPADQNNRPRMAKTANITGQLWRIVRAP